MDDNWPEVGDIADEVFEDGDGHAIKANSVPILAISNGKVYCPKGGEVIPVMATAYGFRAVCGECRIRWTRLRGESEWVAETYSPLEDNRDEVWYGHQ